MAVVISPHEISINSVKYPVVGLLRQSLLVPPEKLVTGDYDENTDPNLSVWNMADFRGGMLCERITDSKQLNRTWWSTCDTRFQGHILLPPLSVGITTPTFTGTITNAGFETGDPPSSWTSLGVGTISRASDVVQAGTYSLNLYINQNGDYGGAYQDLSWDTKYQNVTVTFTAYGCTDVSYGTGAFSVGIDDGVTATYGSPDSSPSFSQVTVTKTLAASASRLRLIVRGLGGAIEVRDWRFDTCAVSYPTSTPVNMFVNYNGNLYAAGGQTLFKLNASTGATIGAVKTFSATITALTVSVDNYLYINLGDADEYWYMDTSGTFTETNALNGTSAVHWDDKYFTADSAGLIHYYTNPHTATPTVNNNGQLAVADNDLQRLLVYRDADGDQIIYGATKAGLWAHAYATAKWLQTDLVLPSHPTVGLGATVWRDGLFISSGLAVHKYTAGSVAAIKACGLEQDDGLPSLRAGEITAMWPGYNEVFAVVDSTYEGATSYSTVMGYNDTGWFNWWEADAVNYNMYAGIMSSVYTYRLWFTKGTTIYYIPLYRNLVNPTKLAGSYTYAAAGICITPWYDALWPGGGKIATKLTLKVTGASATETVVVKYRTDYSNTDLATGWTTLGTIAASGETTYTFGSAAGVAFKAIQFRFDLARGGTTTSSPDIRWAQFYFKKNTVGSGSWVYDVDVDCSQDAYDGRSAGQLIETARDAATSSTLVPISFETDDAGIQTVYGWVKGFQGSMQTGELREGVYTLSLIVPSTS